MRYNVHIVDRMALPDSCDVILALRFRIEAAEERKLLCDIHREAGGIGSNVEPDAASRRSDADVKLTALRSQWEAVARQLNTSTLGAALSHEIRTVLEGEYRSQEQSVRSLSCRGLELRLGERTLIMGILNVTPDSFSDGGEYATVQQAVERAKAMVAEGADIIDLGGESTRPDAHRVSLEEELRRVIPVVRTLQGEIGVPLSIDTYKAEVARQALDAGAHIINDVWRLTADPLMAKVASEYDCPVIMMHNRQDKEYKDLLSGVVADLRESLVLAHQAGIRDEQIILDPGIGFGKTYEHNLQMMNQLRQLSFLGYPLLLGTSRKSMIHRTLGLPPDKVLEGTVATVAHGIAQGCGIVRVHDVKEIKKAVLMADAIARGKAHG